MTFSTDQLRSLVEKERGAAAPNRFRCILPRIGGTQKADGSAAQMFGTVEELNTLCTASRLPGKNFSVVDRNVGLEQIKIANGHTLGDVTLTFYLTNSYNVKKYWQEWSECVMTPVAPFTMGFHKNYAKTVEVQQLNKVGEVVYAVKLRNAFPTTFTEIELNNQAQGQALEFSVSLTYSNYEVV